MKKGNHLPSVHNNHLPPLRTGFTVGTLIEDFQYREGGAHGSLLCILRMDDVAVRNRILADFGATLYEMLESHEFKHSSGRSKIKKRVSSSEDESISSGDPDATDTDDDRSIISREIEWPETQKQKKAKKQRAKKEKANGKKKKKKKKKNPDGSLELSRASWKESIASPPVAQAQREVLSTYGAKTLQQAMTITGLDDDREGEDGDCMLELLRSELVYCSMCERALKLNNPFQPADFIMHHLKSRKHYDVSRSNNSSIGCRPMQSTVVSFGFFACSAFSKGTAD